MKTVKKTIKKKSKVKTVDIRTQSLNFNLKHWINLDKKEQKLLESLKQVRAIKETHYAKYRNELVECLLVAKKKE